MKILSRTFLHALNYISKGWKNSLEASGHEWKWWGIEKPAFDAFDEYEPDMFIGTTYDLDRATMKCISARPNMKVVLKAQNWGLLDEHIQRGGAVPTKTHLESYEDVNRKRRAFENEYPIGISDAEEQHRICDLKARTGKPDLVFNFYHEKRMEETMGKWKDNGVDIIDMQPAADRFLHRPVPSVEELESDLSFVGGYWRYKAINFSRYLVPLCFPVGQYNIKIFGNQPWSVPQYLGCPHDYLINSIFSSAKICPHISEPHANEFGFEVNERVFKLAACKAFCISDNIASLTEDIFTNGEMPTTDDPKEFRSLVDYYLKEPDLRKQKAEECYNVVMNGHTYCHRVSKMFKRLGLPKESDKILKLVEESNANQKK